MKSLQSCGWFSVPQFERRQASFFKLGRAVFLFRLCNYKRTMRCPNFWRLSFLWHQRTIGWFHQLNFKLKFFSFLFFKFKNRLLMVGLFERHFIVGRIECVVHRLWRSVGVVEKSVFLFIQSLENSWTPWFDVVFNINLGKFKDAWSVQVVQLVWNFLAALQKQKWWDEMKINV